MSKFNNLVLVGSELQVPRLTDQYAVQKQLKYPYIYVTIIPYRYKTVMHFSHRKQPVQTIKYLLLSSFSQIFLATVKILINNKSLTNNKHYLPVCLPVQTRDRLW